MRPPRARAAWEKYVAAFDERASAGGYLSHSEDGDMEPLGAIALALAVLFLAAFGAVVLGGHFA